VLSSYSHFLAAADASIVRQYWIGNNHWTKAPVRDRPAFSSWVRSGLMGGGDKTAMKDQDDGFGLAAFLLLSLARLQAVGINGPNDTRLLLDRAILTLENMPFQDEAIRKARIALESRLVLPGGGKGKQ
jgi:hypothetical protein